MTTFLVDPERHACLGLKGLVGVAIPAFAAHEAQGVAKEALTALEADRPTQDIVQSMLREQAPEGAALKLSLPVSPVFSRWTRSLAREHQVTEARVRSALLRLALDRYQKEKGDSQIEPQAPGALGRFLKALGWSPRRHQTEFTKSVGDALSRGKIGLIEAATGVGKTLGVIAAACDLIEHEGSDRIVVTVPTIALINQYADRHEELIACGISMPASRVVFGRGEFVDTEALQMLLATEGAVDRETKSLAQGWLQVQALGAQPGEHARYLKSSLARSCPRLAVEAVVLSRDTNEGDPGMLAYREQFYAAPGAAREILYCTHAMTASDLRLRRLQVFRSDPGRDLSQESAVIYAEAAEAQASGTLPQSEVNALYGESISKRTREMGELALEESIVGLLPEWEHMIIDEAHLFESNVSSVLSDALSLLALKHNAWQARSILTERARSEIDELVATVRAVGAEYGDIDLAADRDESNPELDLMADRILSKLIDCVKALESFFKVKRKAIEACGGEVRRAVSRIRLQLLVLQSAAYAREKKGIRAQVNYSPVREFPRLTVGRRSVAAELQFLWGSATSVALVSATLYLQKLGQPSASHMSRILNVPSDRQQDYDPICPPWTTQPIAGLYTPAPVRVASPSEGTAHLWLRPVSHSDKLSEECARARESVWYDEVADEILHIHETAAGGVLVLNTSYRTVEELAKRFGAESVVANLLCARRDLPLAMQVSIFVQIRRAGAKPLWLAVGGAWTGLDVNGKDHDGFRDPARDDLLTDLVIPRLPFGTERSLTHRTRVESHLQIEAQRCAIQLRQGLGRLVRREGLSHNRRIFVLDARLIDSTFSPSFIAPAASVLQAYPQKQLQGSCGTNDKVHAA